MTEEEFVMTDSWTTYRPLQSPASAEGPTCPPLRRRKIEIEVVKANGPNWMFPGGGSAQHVQVPTGELQAIEEKLRKPKVLLSEWPATAIAGNDILSSVLYSATQVVAKSGKLMPVPLILVSVVLYFFRFIYEEVVTAIPLNGGSYNALLNSTSKHTAAIAATLGIVSYMATGVVSATTGVQYLGNLVDLPVVGCTVALLFAFALLSLLGITDSSRVAAAIFFHHALVLTITVVACSVYAVQHPHVFWDNMKTDYPDVDYLGNMLHGNVFTAIFFGFGASMLGITGFETSAQYVEEQAPGVFRKTLRNMWALASVYNLVLGVLVLAVLPLEGDDGIYKATALLAQTGSVAAGDWLKVWICIDALIVLAGAVLTSYVGITGLVRRLSNDRVLPAFLATTNEWRGTNHYIIFLYFVLASSLVIAMDADSTVLSGVFTYAFLSMMSMFACGCMLLKAKRSDIPRDVHTSWKTVIMGLVMVIVAIFANLLGDPKILIVFAIYFIVVGFVVFVMLQRVAILRAILASMQKIVPSKGSKFDEDGADAYMHTGARGGRTVTRVITKIHDAPMIFFCKAPDLTILNKAVMYVRRNEHTHNLRFVHVYNDEEAEAGVLDEFEQLTTLFDAMYPKIRLDFVSVQGEFTPAMVEWLSQSMEIPKNMMFIRQPGNFTAHKVATSGVRVITA